MTCGAQTVFRRCAALGAAVLLSLCSFSRQSPAAAMEREAAIVARALAFERSLDERVGNRAIEGLGGHGRTM